jgi:DNA-binding response OmpR family regulator
VYLERDGHSVLVVGDRRRTLEHSRARRPDLLVPDVMLPGVDGFDVCRIFRTESDVPNLLVTARCRRTTVT